MFRSAYEKATVAIVYQSKTGNSLDAFANKREQRPCAGSGVGRIDLLRFLAGCRKRRLNQALSVFSVSIGFLSVFCCLLGSIVVVTLVCVCMCSVSRLLLVSSQYWPSDWLERLVWGRLYAIRRLSPQILVQRALMTSGLLCCFVVSLCVCLCSPAVHNLFHTPMARVRILSSLKAPSLSLPNDRVIWLWTPVDRLFVFFTVVVPHQAIDSSLSHS